MAKRRSTSNSIKIFRSLLVLSLLEVRAGARRNKSSCFGGLLWALTPTCCRAQGILWSLCIFYSASSLGSAYYERETVRRGPPTRTGGRPLERRSPQMDSLSVCSPPCTWGTPAAWTGTTTRALRVCDASPHALGTPPPPSTH